MKLAKTKELIVLIIFDIGPLGNRLLLCERGVVFDKHEIEAYKKKMHKEL